MRDHRRRGRLFVLLLVSASACSSAPAAPGEAIDGTLPLGVVAQVVEVEPVAVAGDGRALAAAGRGDGSLAVVTTTGVRSVDGDDVVTVSTFAAAERPYVAAFGPSAELVALAAGQPSTVRILSTTTGEVVDTWPAPAGVDVRDVWFEPVTGRAVVETTSGSVVIAPGAGVAVEADGTTGTSASLPDGTIVGLASPTELSVVAGNERSVRPVALDDGEELTDIQVAPDGSVVGVTASSTDDGFERRDRVVLLDASFAVVGAVEPGAPLGVGSWVLTDRGPVAAIDETTIVGWSLGGDELGRAALSAPIAELRAVGGEVLIVGRDGSVGRWDGSTAPVTLVDGGVTTVYRSVDPRSATITVVDRFGEIAVHRVDDGAPVGGSSAFATGEPTSLAVAGGSVAVGSSNGLVRLFDTELLAPDAELRAAPAGVEVGAVAFAPSGGGLVTGRAERLGNETFDDTVTFWTSDLAERSSVLGEVADVPGCSSFRAEIGFDRNGHLVAASHDFDVAVVDIVSGSVVDELPGSATILDLAVSDDGSTLVVTHDDAVVDVWDLVSRELVATYRPASSSLVAVELLPEGDAMVAVDVGGSMTLLDVETGAELLVFDGQVARAGPLAVSPDGGVVAAALADGDVGFWSTDSGRQVGVAGGHTGPVTAMTFDGDRLFSTSEDGTVRSWSVRVEG